MVTMKDIVDSILPPENASRIEIAASQVGVEEGFKSSNQRILDVQKWLPIAAEKYKTSPKIEDYVISSVIIFPTDIPNRNCLGGDVLVSTNAGMIPIKQLNARDDATHVLVKNGKARIKNWMRSGFKPVHDVYTKMGRHIRATSTHPFLVYNPSNSIFKWKRLDALEIGDRVVVKTGSLVEESVDLTSINKQVKHKITKLHNSYPGGSGRYIETKLPEMMTKNLASLIGYFQSEGYFGKNRITFVNTDKDLLRDVKCKIKSVFGIDVAIKRKLLSDRGTKTVYSIAIDRQDVAIWFKQIGLFSTQTTREVPSVILESSPEHIKAYLKAYIEGDGCIEHEQIRIHTACKNTALQLQQLLQSLDILSVVTTRPPSKEGFILHEVSVAESFEALDKIGIVSDGSKNTKKTWEKARENRATHNSRYRMLPIEVRSWISTIIKRHHVKNVKGGAHYLDNKGNPHTINFEIAKLGSLTKRPSKEKLRAIRDRLGLLDPMYANIVDELTGDFVFDEITSVQLHSVLEPVYDIETTAAQFSANGIIVHNSVAFPYEELMKFNVSQGRPNFKTWVGKPTYYEHQHNDYEKAKGIVFDTFLRPLKHSHGHIYKLIALCGFDRSKDPELARSIQRGERKSYSMGAFISQYECSICGSLSKPKKLNTECGHVIRGRPEIFIQEETGARVPSYLIARNEITGFEVSSVGVPAWASATSSNIFDMSRY